MFIKRTYLMKSGGKLLASLGEIRYPGTRIAFLLWEFAAKQLRENIPVVNRCIFYNETGLQVELLCPALPG